MIILDTDHFTVLRYADHRRYSPLKQRLLSAHDERIGSTVVTVEEQLRGWLAAINRWPDIAKQLPAYARLLELLDALSEWEILPLDKQAANPFVRLRKPGLRIGTQDLKIAAITLCHGGLLLSANVRDFRRVPGLRIENWLD